MERASAAISAWIVVALNCISAIAAEAPAEPRKSDGQIAKAVTSLLQRESLSKQPLNDELAGRVLDRYLLALDPQRHYFLQADVDEFAKSRDALDDQLKVGDVKFAFTV